MTTNYPDSGEQIQNSTRDTKENLKMGNFVIYFENGMFSMDYARNFSRLFKNCCSESDLLHLMQQKVQQKLYNKCM